jgi:hypothetical protein
MRQNAQAFRGSPLAFATNVERKWSLTSDQLSCPQAGRGAPCADYWMETRAPSGVAAAPSWETFAPLDATTLPSTM